MKLGQRTKLSSHVRALATFDELQAYGRQLRVVADEYAGQLLRFRISRGALQLGRDLGDVVPQRFAAVEHVGGD